LELTLFIGHYVHKHAHPSKEILGASA